jgi:competence transcription factor ComK
MFRKYFHVYVVTTLAIQYDKGRLYFKNGQLITFSVRNVSLRNKENRSHIHISGCSEFYRTHPNAIVMTIWLVKDELRLK